MTRRRRSAVAALLAPVVALAVSLAAAPAGATEDPAVPVDAVVVAETTPVGYKVTAVAVEYSREIDLGSAPVPPSTFAVTAALTRDGETDTGPRTVVRAYTSDQPEPSAKARAGRYVVIELGPGDANAPASYYEEAEGGFARAFNYDLVGAYTVTQTADLVGNDQVVPAPADPVANSSVRSLIVDDFDAGSHTSKGGTRLDYRLFEPAEADSGGEAEYPLVVTLHGAGESGTDNVSQIAGNQLAVAFADPARQAEHPSFVLSPQRRPDMNWFWNDAGMEGALLELIEETARRYPIDRDRIYVTGLSMGSLGWWAILPEHQDVFAGAILICGLGDEAAVRSLTSFPIWATHSRDDPIVAYDVPGSDDRLMRSIEAAGAPVTWGEWAGNLPDAEAEAEAAALWRQADAAGSRHLFTTFAPGTTPIFPHASWVPTYTNGVLLDWLFSQVRDSAKS
jgi:predicted peptidase